MAAPQPPQGAPGTFGYNDYGQLINSAQPTNYILAFILGALQRLTGGGAAGGSGLVVSSGVGTYIGFQINSGGASGTVNGVTTANVTIPTAAKRWTLENVGTGNDSTFNGTIMAGGISRFDNGSPAAPITLVAGAANIITGFYSTT